MRHVRTLSFALVFLALVAVPVSGQDVTGTWVLTVNLGTAGRGAVTLVLVQEGTAITGTYEGSAGQGLEVTGTVEAGVVRVALEGPRGEISLEGTIDGTTMKGTYIFSGLGDGTFEGSLAFGVEPLWGGALVSKIDALAEAALAEGSVAALSIGVQRGGDVLLVKGYGLADIENDVPATSETVYRIGSITKQFTAASVMQLVEAGQIGLDDPMTEYLPDYPMQGHEVTIRHLLTHTSGIKSYTGMAEWRPKMKLDLTDEELLDIFSAEPFDFDPGERFLYNNSGFYLLGVIIGKAGDEPYAEYLDTHLFRPLDLPGSSYCDERRIIRGRAEGYQFVDGELLNDEYLSMNQPGAAGALCSTVVDLLSWTSALRVGRVLSAASYQQMTTRGTLNNGSATSYGFGLGLGSLVGHPSVSHGGGINGFSTQLAHYPEADLDVVVLSNTPGAHVGRVAQTIAKWALGIEVPEVLDEPISAEDIAAYEGLYELRAGFEITVSSRGGQLFAQATGQGAFRLKAQGDHTFVASFDDNVRVEFVVEGGTATTFILFQNGRAEAPRVR